MLFLQLKIDKMENITPEKFIISYGSKSCSLSDYTNYKNNIYKCKDLEKISVLVYLNAEINNMKIEKDYMCIDYIMEEFIGKQPLPYLVMILDHYKIQDIPYTVFNIVDCKDEDECFDLLLNFLHKLNI